MKTNTLSALFPAPSQNEMNKFITGEPKVLDELVSVIISEPFPSVPHLYL